MAAAGLRSNNTEAVSLALIRCNFEADRHFQFGVGVRCCCCGGGGRGGGVEDGGRGGGVGEGGVGVASFCDTDRFGSVNKCLLNQRC